MVTWKWLYNIVVDSLVTKFAILWIQSEQKGKDGGNASSLQITSIGSKHFCKKIFFYILHDGPSLHSEINVCINITSLEGSIIFLKQSVFQYFPWKACHCHHSEGKSEAEHVKLNFLGLPLRPVSFSVHLFLWGYFLHHKVMLSRSFFSKL